MKTFEIDYYTDRDLNGLRSCVRTTRLEVPDETTLDDAKLPFMLSDKLGKHEGIRRVKVIVKINNTLVP